jgi:hypothetical protein
MYEVHVDGQIVGEPYSTFCEAAFVADGIHAELRGPLVAVNEPDGHYCIRSHRRPGDPRGEGLL